MNQNKNPKGMALVMALLVLIVISITALSIASVSLKERNVSIGESQSSIAFQNAQSGMEKVMNEIKLMSSNDIDSLTCKSDDIYEVLLFDEDGEIIECSEIDDAGDIAQISKMKSIGMGRGVQRAIEVGVTPSSVADPTPTPTPTIPTCTQACTGLLGCRSYTPGNSAEVTGAGINCCGEKCYTCRPGTSLVNGNCVIVSSYSCTNAPSNATATLCPGDDTGLTANTTSRVVSSCANNTIKCEYRCNSGYEKSGNSCVRSGSGSSGEIDCHHNDASYYFETLTADVGGTQVCKAKVMDGSLKFYGECDPYFANINVVPGTFSIGGKIYTVPPVPYSSSGSVGFSSNTIIPGSCPSPRPNDCTQETPLYCSCGNNFTIIGTRTRYDLCEYESASTTTPTTPTTCSAGFKLGDINTGVPSTCGPYSTTACGSDLSAHNVSSCSGFTPSFCCSDFGVLMETICICGLKE